MNNKTMDYAHWDSCLRAYFKGVYLADLDDYEYPERWHYQQWENGVRYIDVALQIYKERIYESTD